MPNFIKFGGMGACRQYGEMYTSRTFLFFDPAISRATLQKKNSQQFQALNGLKCSTVGNLGSYWAFVIMLLGFTHFLEDKVNQKLSYH